MVTSTSEVVALASALVAAESINPTLVPGGSGEAAAAEVVVAWARGAGLSVETDEAAPGRPNVLVRAPGIGEGARLLLNGHLDTVGVTGMERPFTPELRAGNLYGRGAYDMKGGLAAALVAAAAAHKERLAGEVVVACVIDEEHQSTGTQRLVERLSAEAAIVCEPTDEQVCSSHKGFVGFEIEMPGRAAHGSRPDLGIDAIAAIGPVLTRLGELAQALRSSPGDELLGPGSVHASLISGGQEYSSYPARCLLTAERRTVPGESLELIQAELDALVAGTEANVRVTFSRDPFRLDPNGQFTQTLVRLAGAGAAAGVPFWTDAALLAAAGIPTLVYGPRGGGAHGVEEWVELASLERCSRVYLEAARRFCAERGAPD